MYNPLIRTIRAWSQGDPNNHCLRYHCTILFPILFRRCISEKGRERERRGDQPLRSDLFSVSYLRASSRSRWTGDSVRLNNFLRSEFRESDILWANSVWKKIGRLHLSVDKTPLKRFRVDGSDGRNSVFVTKAICISVFELRGLYIPVPRENPNLVVNSKPSVDLIFPAIL